MRAQEQDREEIAQARARWENDQRKIPAEKLVFIDETGTSTQMSRRYGRCAKKRRLIGKAPCGQWKTTTFVAALRSKGLTAPMVLDGPEFSCLGPTIPSAYAQAGRCSRHG
jgi:hypothetical protein